MYLIILSGGVGSRLWPASRKLHPKPFIKMPNGYSILQNTFLRAINLQPHVIIDVTNAEYLFKIKEEWNELPLVSKKALPSGPSYILEPFGKNTAAAIAMTCLWVADRAGKDTILLVLPSDHLISDQEAFNKAVGQANKLAMINRIVAFGIVPNSPETGYGYIEFNGDIVKNFIEKPSPENAMMYLESGKYLWNSGMFCFKAKVMLEEMAKHCPDILLSSQKCFEASYNGEDKTILNIDAESFQKVRNESIDYAVMEKSDNISVIPCDIGWSDIGDWNAISQMYERDANGNIINAKVVTEKVTNCYIEGNNRLVAAVGVENLIIVDTPDALLIAHKNNVQDVKNIYNNLVKQNHQTHNTHLTVYRPWGRYTVLEEQNGFKVKRVEINPNASLSLQSHQYRSEHWVVVAGQAKVVNGDQELLLNVSQSTYISAGNKHRLSNPSSTESLVIIEVQTGSYLGEDDIRRFEDVYNRIGR